MPNCTKFVKKLAEADLLTKLFDYGLGKERAANDRSELHDVKHEWIAESSDDHYPSSLDFYNFKRGKISRKGRTEKEKSNASWVKSANIKHVNIDRKIQKRAKMYLINKAKKAEKKNRDSEWNAKHIQSHDEMNYLNCFHDYPDETFLYESPSYDFHDSQHILRRDNADKFGSQDLLSRQLITIQEREITPEDFDLLLQLDSFVEIKTAPNSVIDTLRTEKIEVKCDDVSPCMICMGDYVPGQVIMYLECEHFFHSNCIRTWLSVNSTKCPLDGLEVC